MKTVHGRSEMHRKKIIIIDGNWEKYREERKTFGHDLVAVYFDKSNNNSRYLIIIMNTTLFASCYGNTIERPGSKPNNIERYRGENNRVRDNK